MKIRRIIYDFPKTEKRLMTVAALKDKLRNDPEINFEGSHSSLLKIVHSLGFKHKKARNDRTIIIERAEIRAKRIRFINQVKKWRAEGRRIFYLDETYIHQNLSTNKRWDDATNESQMNPISHGSRYIIVHAGDEEGFLQGAGLVFKSGLKTGDYHDDMNGDNYSRWVITQLIPNLPPNSVVVIDNAPYHNKQSNKAPNMNANKATMQQWLRDHQIPFKKTDLKATLYDLIKEHKHKFITYEFDALFEEKGHTVLR
jgi:hypothetical protein